MASKVEWLAGLAASCVNAALGRRVAILTYHRVLPEIDPFSPGTPDVPTFDWQMRVLAEAFHPLSLADAHARLEQGTLPAGSVVVTFDDGYADNFTLALPVLRKWKVPATFFIATGFLNGGRMFNDTVIETVRRVPNGQLDASWLGVGSLPVSDGATRYRAIETLIGALKYRPLTERAALVERLASSSPVPLPGDLMMTDDQVRGLEGGGMTIGAHTRNHPILAELDVESAREEITSGRDDLAEMLGRPIKLFAYPNGRPGGDYRPEHRELVAEAGFDCAVSTAWGCASRRSDSLQLPRLAALGASSSEFAARLARAYLTTQ